MLSFQLQALFHCMPVKRVAHRNHMAKKSMKMQAVGWTASTLTDADLAKAKEWAF
jgi:hypothetical protein